MYFILLIGGTDEALNMFIKVIFFAAYFGISYIFLDNMMKIKNYKNKMTISE